MTATEYHRAWREANREKYSAYQAEYRATHKERLRQQQAEWREANRERLAAQKAEWYRDNAERIREKARERRQTDGDTLRERNRLVKRRTARDAAKERARMIASHAIKRGELKPELCEQCGATERAMYDGKRGIQAHHDDYSKPLDVRWLCVDCHAFLHRRVA